MLRNNLSLDQISQFTGLSQSEIAEVKIKNRIE
jgi:hypothetical protein